MKLITFTDYQVHITLVIFSMSWIQKSESQITLSKMHFLVCCRRPSSFQCLIPWKCIKRSVP